MPARTSRRLLLCQIGFENLAGSEVVSLEIVEWFVERGWAVDVATTVYGGPIALELAAPVAAGDVRILLLGETADLRAEHYDLIWINHAFVPRSIIEQLAEGPIATPMVWHHMSSFQTLGLPLLADAEDGLASIITCMAPVARDSVAEFGFEDHRLEIFDNPAPDAFVTFSRRVPAERLESLLIVSNHPPPELLDASQQLESAGVRVALAGLTGDYGRVTPSMIAEHDAVVTIGKSTQYCLVMGVPVFSYDHFGGGGWITEQNLEREHYGNFAGRIARRVLSAEQLVAEIRSGYPGAREFALDYRPVAAERWSLSRQLEAILADERLTPRQRGLSPVQVRRTALLCAERDELWAAFRHAQRRVAMWEADADAAVRAELRHRVDELEAALTLALKTEPDVRGERDRALAALTEARAELDHVNADLMQAQAQLAAMLESRSWRVTAPLRMLRSRTRRAAS